jgi:purine-binding chemotaxis protein CheW
VFQLDRQCYAVSSDVVRELTTIDHVTAIPHAPAHVRGVCNQRGAIVPVLDLRVWLGMPSAHEGVLGLIQEMRQREQDHRDWLNELEASVREKRAFSKTTDPHKCAFGKWYDSFQTDDIFVRSLLREFDAPHQAIHAVATRVLAASDRQDFDGAHALIEQTRGEKLGKMIELFGRFRQSLQDSLREQVVVVDMHRRPVALVVDNIVSVERLGDTFDATEFLPGEHRESCVSFIGRRRSDDSPVLIPDVELLLTVSAESVSSTCVGG